MKKLTLMAITATMVSLGAQGQGLVTFGNSAGLTSRISVNTTFGGAATGQYAAGAAGTYYFALFYSTTATTVNGNANAFYPTLTSVGNYVWNDTNWHFAGGSSGQQTYTLNGNIFSSDGYAASTGAAGRMLSTLYTSESVESESVVGLAAGATAQFVVVGWSSNMGTTYGAVESFLTSGNVTTGMYLGESAVGAPTVTGDNFLNASPTIMAATVVPAFTLGLYAIPEPSTMVLVGLGGLSLLLFRRR
ncbi:MAG: PEP-CTERM sorting domain-containing protein [Verrucomicrobiota bacterium]